MPLIAGATVAAFIATTILIFFPSLTWTEADWQIALSWGFWIMPWSFGFWGLVLGFRYYTDKVLWDNWVVECSDQKEIPLGTISLAEKEGQALPDPTLTPAQAETLAHRGAAASGTTPRRTIVDLAAMGFGGFWAWKFADYPGKEGYVLFYGKEHIRVGGNVFIPKHRVFIHHTQVDQRILTALEIATKDAGEGRFIPYKTPLYRCGDMLPEIVNFMCDNDEIRTGVVERIGVPGVARSFAASVLREIGPERAKELGISMKGWEALIDPAREYLLNAGLYAESTQKGVQTVGGLRTKIEEMQEQLTSLENAEKSYLGTIEKLRAMVYGDVSRMGRYSGGWEGERPVPPAFGADRTRPGYDQAANTRQ